MRQAAGRYRRSKLIAAKAANDIFPARDSGESFADLHQKAVAARMAEPIVNGFETIEIDKNKRDLLLLGAGGVKRNASCLNSARRLGSWVSSSVDECSSSATFAACSCCTVVSFPRSGNELREQAHDLFAFEVIRLLLPAGGAEGAEQRAVGRRTGMLKSSDSQLRAAMQECQRLATSLLNVH